LSAPRPVAQARDIIRRWHITVPGLATAWLGFRAGGFFAGTVGVVAVVLALTLVIGRITGARRPFSGFSPALALASGALAGFAVWILCSSAWSDAPARALSECDRVVLYGLVLILTGTVAARQGDLSAVLRWTAAALVAFAIAGLITRLWPATFPISGGVLPERVAFPLTYWNAMGIACALGVVLTFHLTASGAEPRVVRVVAAAALTPVAVTLYFTFSRGAIWVLPAGLVLYALLAQPRGLVTALAAAIPAVIAVKVAYGADLLAQAGFDSPAAASQGRHVGIVVAICAVVAAAARAAALPLDVRLERVRLPRRAREALAAAVVVALLGGALAAGAPHRVAEARQTFSEGRYYAGSSDLRARLTSAVDNGRVDNWRVALDGFDSSPLHGTGAGTYRLTWELHRPAPPVQMTDGHSLYLETLSELGVPGLALLLVVLGTLLIGGVRRLGGPERHAHGAFVAAGTMLALHAGVDWDWEMPALFVWLFGAGGVVLAAREGAGRWGEISRTPRIVAALAVLVLALTPALMWLSQGPLDRATAAFARNDCPTAIDASLDAIGRFGVRPEPWEILGYCDARAGQYALATRAMDAARSRDPHDWSYAYGQAIVDGVSGRDPRPAAREALRLNPLEPLARTLVRELDRARDPARRREIARRAGIPFG
jgi:hypothetical protein